MEYIDSGHNEWPEMWEQLANQTINGGDQLCIYGRHCWQYMGSTIDHHTFRHEYHPLTEKTEYIYLERSRAAIGWA